MVELKGQRFERYEILEQIGRGGMAAVYRAYDRESDRFVAIKVVASHLSEDPNFQKRFRLEAKVLSNLRHPNIIPVEDYGEEEGFAYLVMPFLKVGTLTDRLLEGPVSPQYGALLVQQISEALQYSHDHGVVHRDVKPSNILLDEGGNALLSDFGLARLQEAHASLTGSMMVGTPAFISPEQAKGEKADALSDQYSLGVILYQLTTGELPFDAETPIAVVLKHISEPLPNLQSVSPNVPEAIEQVILKATAKVPSERFESVAKLNEAFQAAIAHVLDPHSNPSPDIRLPGSVGATQVMPAVDDPDRRSKLRLALAGAGAIMALVLAFPVLAAYGRPTEAREMAPSQPAGAAEISAGLEATMAAMATELAGSRAELMRAEQVQTAVVRTLQAEEVYPTATPDEVPAGESSITYLTPQALFLPTETKTQRPIATESALQLPQPTATPPLSSTVPTPTSPSEVPPTPTSTNAVPPTPTSSSIPPTATPEPDPCAGLNHSNFSLQGDEVSWKLTNNGATEMKITRLVLDWPAANSILKKVRFGGSQIWNSGDSTPPSDIQGDWKGSSSWRNLAADSSEILSFEFSSPAAASDYDLTVEFDGVCAISD